MGGAVGMLRAAQDTRIKHLISLAGMVETARFVEAEFGAETPDAGFMWEEERCPLSSTFMNDLRAIGSVAYHITQVKVPVLFIYGTDDDLVPIGEGRDIYTHAHEPKKFVELAGANHVFGGDATAQMVNAVIDWLGAQTK
jgi:hypothetical protein